MRSALAGLVGFSDRGSAEARLRSAFPEAAISSLDGGLVVAAGRACQSYRSPELAVFVDGRLSNREALAGELGLGPGVGDPEMVGIGHTRMGDAVLTHLRGDFALLVWDLPRARGYLARDQVGGRSLFYRQSSPTVEFAAEIPDLLAVLRSHPGPDDGAVSHWLAHLAPPPGQTLFSCVARLRAGWLLPLPARSEMPPRPYWRPRYRTPDKVGIEAAARMATEELASATSRALSGAERVGVLLSGGLDSSTAAVTARDQGFELAAYSAVFPRDPETDESGLIGEVAASLRIPSTRVEVDAGSALRGAFEHIETWKTPTPVANDFFWRPLLRRAKRDGIDTTIDGEGGDELWLADPFLLADRLGSGRVTSAMTLLLAQSPSGERRARARWMANAAKDYGLRGVVPYRAHLLSRRIRPAEAYAPDWFSPMAAGGLAATETSWAWKLAEGPRWWRHMSLMLTDFRDMVGVAEHLRRRAESLGLTARHPLIDVDLIEFALGLPPELAFSGARPLIREVLKGRVPESIRTRSAKSVFNPIFRRSLLEADGPLLRALLGSDAEVRRWIRPDRVQAMLERSHTGAGTPRSDLWALWRLAPLEMWLRSQAGGRSTLAELFDEHAVGDELQIVGG